MVWLIFWLCEIGGKMTMRLDTKPGEKVSFLDENGYPDQLCNARCLFKKGDILTVHDVECASFTSLVVFEEHRDLFFNTVMFENT